MTFTSKLKGKAFGALLGPIGDRAFQALDDARRRLARAPSRLDFYYDVADPWSHLAAQVTLRLARAYPVEVAVHVVTPPASDVDHAGDMRRKHATRDARDLASHWDLEYPGKGDAEPNAVKRASQIMIKPRPPLEQLEVAIAIGNATWASDVKGLTALMGKYGHESAAEVPPILNANYIELRKRGFYHAASWNWNGEWYAGLDRVHYLEAALARDTGTSAPPVLTARPPMEPERIAGVKGDRPVVDFWFSFRSPYSYLAIDRVAALAATYPIELRVRPILPMVQRGAALPKVKGLYIVRDAKREADRLGIPFGEIADPLGKGVEHALAIAHVAGPKLLDFLRSAGRGAWAESMDLASYVDLRAVVERAGIDWDVAKAALASDGWREWAKTNADDLAVAGLWGVPSFKVGDYATWGQDRIPFLEDRLRRHFAAPVPIEAPARSDSA
jgi:2-hydroxychromene-2-carboxylate isomerase